MAEKVKAEGKRWSSLLILLLWERRRLVAARFGSGVLLRRDDRRTLSGGEVTLWDVVSSIVSKESLLCK